MDNDLLKKLAHLKILLKRNGGIAVDIINLVAQNVIVLILQLFAFSFP